jgi:hypothetical protein
MNYLRREKPFRDHETLSEWFAAFAEKRFSPDARLA